MTYSDNLPPGCPSPHSTSVEAYCRNPNCGRCGEAVEKLATWELGATYLLDEDDVFCQECGWELDLTGGDRHVLLAQSTQRDTRHAVVRVVHGGSEVVGAGSYTAMVVVERDLRRRQ